LQHSPQEPTAKQDVTPVAAFRNPLSKRELEVLRLMVKGKSSKEIGAELGISFKTAVTHRASVMSKLDVHETASAVREAIRRGLVDLSEPGQP
jgi:DNA-binding NarL/FixJ family response regulator